MIIFSHLSCGSSPLISVTPRQHPHLRLITWQQKQHNQSWEAWYTRQRWQHAEKQDLICFSFYFFPQNLSHIPRSIWHFIFIRSSWPGSGPGLDTASPDEVIQSHNQSPTNSGVSTQGEGSFAFVTPRQVFPWHCCCNFFPRSQFFSKDLHNNALLRRTARHR